MKNITIRTKLLIGFITVALLSGIVGWVGYKGLINVMKSQDEITSNRMPSVESILKIALAQKSVWIGERGLTNMRMMDPAIRKAQYDYIVQAFSMADSSWKIYASFAKTGVEKDVWNAFVAQWNSWKLEDEKVVNLSKNVDKLIAQGYTLNSKEVIKLSDQTFEASLLARSASLATEKSLNKLIEINIRITKELDIAADNDANTSTTLLIIFIVSAIALALVLGFTISGNIQRIIKKVIHQTQELINAAIEGQLKTRSKPEETNEEFREIIIGINNILDAVILPLNVAADYIDNISKGKIPEKITDQYKGDFNTLKNNLNQCIDGLGGLIEANNVLQKMATNDYTMKVEGKYLGVFAEVAQSINFVNQRITHVVQIVENIAKGDLDDLKELEKLGKRSDNDKLMPSIIDLIRTLNQIAEKAKLVSEGDLTVTLSKRSEKDDLIGSLSEMVARLNEIVAQVMEASNNVAISSNEMSSSAVQLSQGANEQASSAEEISSSIEEMTTTIQQNSDNAYQTEKIAVTSSQGIDDVNQASLRSLEAIRQIVEKIKVINNIAEKTDILAINAAIEAARAGEHGKGFAVVAAEVRKLAETSQKAAIEINQLSAGSLQITENTSVLMSKIIPDIQRTAQLVQEIAASSAEQSSGANMIAKAIEQLSQVTQQNSATAEEMSSSSEELASQADMLKETISFFRIDKQINVTAHHKVTTPKKIIPVQQSHSHKNTSKGVDIQILDKDQPEHGFEKY